MDPLDIVSLVDNLTERLGDFESANELHFIKGKMLEKRLEEIERTKRMLTLTLYELKQNRASLEAKCAEIQTRFNKISVELPMLTEKVRSDTQTIANLFQQMKQQETEFTTRKSALKDWQNWIKDHMKDDERIQYIKQLEKQCSELQGSEENDELGDFTLQDIQSNIEEAKRDIQECICRITKKSDEYSQLNKSVKEQYEHLVKENRTVEKSIKEAKERKLTLLKRRQNMQHPRNVNRYK
ncbi:hypothetical protein PCE1_000514 [Barthelona sp. PCE]